MSGVAGLSSEASFILFAAISWGVMLALFAVARRRGRYFRLAPFVAAYAAVAALLLAVTELGQYFGLYLVMSAAFFLVTMRNHLSSAGGREALARLQSAVLESIEEVDIKQRVAREISPRRAIWQDSLVSTAVFVIVLTVTFYVVNRGF